MVNMIRRFLCVTQTTTRRDNSGPRSRRKSRSLSAIFGPPDGPNPRRAVSRERPEYPHSAAAHAGDSNRPWDSLARTLTRLRSTGPESGASSIPPFEHLRRESVALARSFVAKISSCDFAITGRHSDASQFLILSCADFPNHFHEYTRK